MLVLVPTVGTKVGTNFMNNSKYFNFFQRNFFFKGKLFFFQKLFILRKKWYPFLNFFENENFVWKLVPTLVPLVGVGTNRVWYPGQNHLTIESVPESNKPTTHSACNSLHHTGKWKNFKVYGFSREVKNHTITSIYSDGALNGGVGNAEWRTG